MRTVRPLDNIIGKFHPIFMDALADDGHSEFWMHGGRGSTKSSAVSIILIILMATFPFVNGVVFRRYGNSLRGTVYEQIVWAIGKLGLSDSFSFGVAPMEITYRPTGQKIVFIGVDDPGKTKGAKFRTGYGAFIWFEEVNEFPSWEFVSQLLRTYRRGGDRFWTFYTYNPPKTRWSWVNQKCLEMERKADCLVDSSTYIDVVEDGHADWLGSAFIEDAEYERDEHPAQYRWEFLGEPTGNGGEVFDNIVSVDIGEDELASYDNRRIGVDWGWFPDPWRLVQCEWQPARRRLVIFGERSANRTTPRETGRMVREAQTYCGTYHDDPIWCDSADQTSINVYRRECGLNARAADKGNMRKPSYEWLAGLREIAIDPRRAPLAYEEFTLCEYARDRTGQWIGDYTDGNDHSIDAVRYAMMRDIRRGA